MVIVRYELRIAGWLSERARGAFQGMRVDRVPPETTIRADLGDQTDLRGLLGQCSSMGLHVVSVRLLPDTAADPADARRPQRQA